MSETVAVEETGTILDQSILGTVREICNLEAEDNAFDGQLIPLINAQLMVAHQIGIGKNGFIVTGTRETWQDLLGDKGDLLAAAQSWLGYSVKLLFDPPDNGSVLKAYQDQVQKFEWMLNVKSQTEGTVKEYVTESQAKVYDELYDYDEDA